MRRKTKKIDMSEEEIESLKIEARETLVEDNRINVSIPGYLHNSLAMISTISSRFLFLGNTIIANDLSVIFNNFIEHV